MAGVNPPLPFKSSLSAVCLPAASTCTSDRSSLISRRGPEVKHRQSLSKSTYGFFFLFFFTETRITLFWLFWLRGLPLLSGLIIDQFWSDLTSSWLPSWRQREDRRFPSIGFWVRSWNDQESARSSTDRGQVRSRGFWVFLSLFNDNMDLFLTVELKHFCNYGNLKLTHSYIFIIVTILKF